MMLIKIFLFLMLINSIIMVFSTMPLMMGLLLFIQTILIILTSGMMTYSFWYSYMMYLIMLGGMMVLFMYMVSLSPNQKFSMFKKKYYLSFNKNFMLIFLTTIILLISWTIINLEDLYFVNLNTMSLLEIKMEENYFLKLSLYKMYNKPTNQLMVLFINYLLMMMFIVIKITNINLGPIRKKN